MSWVKSEIYSYVVGFEEVFNMYGTYYMLGLLAWEHDSKIFLLSINVMVN
jgi:hypothetical protein